MTYNAITDESVESQDMMFISINNHIKDIYSFFKRQHSNVMIMHFGDYGEDYIQTYWGQPTGIFNEYKAKKLYNFIKANKDKHLSVIHCGAGISRSGAIGTFIFDMYGETTYEEFKRKNPRIEPNQHILKLLNEQRRKDESENT
jgi:predicted protein tyrosine phosphatase